MASHYISSIFFFKHSQHSNKSYVNGKVSFYEGLSLFVFHPGFPSQNVRISLSFLSCDKVAVFFISSVENCRGFFDLSFRDKVFDFFLKILFHKKVAVFDPILRAHLKLMRECSPGNLTSFRKWQTSI